jgi:hypothetical protein
MQIIMHATMYLLPNTMKQRFDVTVFLLCCCFLVCAEATLKIELAESV